MASYGSGNYGGGDYGESNTYGSAGGYTPSSSTVEGTAVPVASSVTAEGNTYQSSPSLAQHPSTMPDSKMKVDKFQPVNERPPQAPQQAPSDNASTVTPAEMTDTDVDPMKAMAASAGVPFMDTSNKNPNAAGDDGWQGTPKVYNHIEGCPAGLEPIHGSKGVWVYQETQYFEAVAQALNIDYNQNNRYQIMDLEGNTMFRAVESTGFCWRCCCGSNRPFDMFILDEENTKILSMHRRFTWCPCAWPGCLEDIRVYHGPHDKHDKNMEGMIGRVTQNLCGGWFKPTVFASTPMGEQQIKLKGPFCIGEFCSSDFMLEDKTNTIGSITRSVNTGKDFGRAVLSNADNFVVEWPEDLDTQTKATLLASLFWMDFAFFESGGAAKFNPYDQSCILHLCTCYCMGCPCNCTLKLGGESDSNNGAPVAGEMDR